MSCCSQHHLLIWYPWELWQKVLGPLPGNSGNPARQLVVSAQKPGNYWHKKLYRLQDWSRAGLETTGERLSRISYWENRKGRDQFFFFKPVETSWEAAGSISNQLRNCAVWLMKVVGARCSMRPTQTHKVTWRLFPGGWRFVESIELIAIYPDLCFIIWVCMYVMASFLTGCFGSGCHEKIFTFVIWGFQVLVLYAGKKNPEGWAGYQDKEKGDTTQGEVKEFSLPRRESTGSLRTG